MGREPIKINPQIPKPQRGRDGGPKGLAISQITQIKKIVGQEFTPANVRRGFLSLGSNLRDRRENLRRALAALGEHEAIKLGRVSGVYETAPVGVTEQPDFLNLVAEIETALSGRELLGAVKEIEKNLGRSAGPRWGARKIDIDILLLEGENIVETELHIPHARMLERAFVMVPLAELEPDLRFGGETAASIAARLAKEQKIHADLPL